MLDVSCSPRCTRLHHALRADPERLVANHPRDSQRATDWGLGEPINIIISNLSSPDVLRESGFVAYSRSLGFWAEVSRLRRSRKAAR